MFCYFKNVGPHAIPITTQIKAQKKTKCIQRYLFKDTYQTFSDPRLRVPLNNLPKHAAEVAKRRYQSLIESVPNRFNCKKHMGKLERIPETLEKIFKIADYQINFQPTPTLG